MKQMRFRVTDYILLAVFVLFVLVTLLLLNRYEIMQTVNAVRELL